LVNLGDNHVFISKEYNSIDMRSFGETKSKATRTYTESGQYYIIVEGYSRAL